MRRWACLTGGCVLLEAAEQLPAVYLGLTQADRLAGGGNLQTGLAIGRNRLVGSVPQQPEGLRQHKSQYDHQQNGNQPAHRLAPLLILTPRCPLRHNCPLFLYRYCRTEDTGFQGKLLQYSVTETRFSASQPCPRLSENGCDIWKTTSSGLPPWLTPNNKGQARITSR